MATVAASASAVAAPERYNDAVVRAHVIATVFWGLAGFIAGLYIALELAFPALNADLSFLSFGRLRPLHTSAVVFAFGGNALLATSLTSTGIRRSVSWLNRVCAE